MLGKGAHRPSLNSFCVVQRVGAGGARYRLGTQLPTSPLVEMVLTDNAGPRPKTELRRTHVECTGCGSGAMIYPMKHPMKRVKVCD